jgi:CheY-like chemotaxis protein
MEQRLQAEKMESIGRLSGTIAHNFNNLLTVITSYAGLARDSLVPADPVRRFVEEISKATDRAVDVTRQLSMFSRQQAAAPQVFCLNELVVNLAEVLKPLIGDRVALSLQTSAERALIRANSGLWEQVLVNLAMNARDAMPDGGCLTISTARVEIGSEEASRRGDVLPGSYLRLEVRDSGTGMAPEVKQHLFEPFFTTKGRGKGLGLGLVTVYGTVQQSGGVIEVQSEPCNGTAISMLLPRVEQLDGRLPGDRTGSGMPAAESVGLRVFDGQAITNETVLVVDDEPELRELAVMTLRNQGYTVLEAASGEEALLVSREHDGSPIHLLLTDAIMPQMGGQQLLKRLQQDHTGLRSLFISGYTNENLVWQGELAGVVEFLQKPFTPKGLLRRVR